MRLILAFGSLLALCGCMSAPPMPPRIERLPEGAAGPIAKPTAPTLDEIVRMAREGTPSGVIVQKLRDARASYAISAEQEARLAAQGVSPDVIGYLRYGDAVPALQPAPMVWPGPYYGPYLYPYPYGAYSGYRRSYGWYGPYGPAYPRSGFYFGFGRRW
jgi:hypothetical protein